MSCYPCSSCGMYDGAHRGGCAELEPDRFERELARRHRNPRYPLCVNMTRQEAEQWMRERGLMA